MKRKMTALVVAGLATAMLLGGASIASAGDRLQLRDRDQLKDGSCLVAGDRLQLRDQLKDGSCLVAGDRLKVRKQLKDSSC